MAEIIKGKIGKQDFEIQTNTDPSETFQRKTSTGGTINLTKIPDIWDGTGKIYLAEVYTDKIVTSATDPSDITETIAAGTLTHDIIKAKINAILATMRIAGFFT